MHSGKTFSRTFAPTKSRAEWYANELFHTLGKNEMREFRSTLRNLLKDSEE